MAKYEVLLRQSVLKQDLLALPKADVQKIVKAIRGLGEEPRPRGVQKLTGQEYYRIRQGRYRILYSIQDEEKTVWVVKVGHRREVYR
ncbi:MAG TPA: type II toxin-antitoxin system RelE/ParE family toxin [Kiritimatiellia bacterium]|jgi:mRNA interferase RelE/StbE|nr:MAG: Toxin RelG [Verrucomicrobia bacterium ADurb.Bin018]HOD99795.1 type II toxin-antitoxin system RelE/ParE family toxin [Kiritimatiellia bacterium]HOE36755.1 type II toxin-antitoxin system RelE/ParE family toxin [Kiritimatiellia bacterium]HOU58699.1 type II toxin-antitoxin system RelE/ParE family toxin [Kiritimatiellia bacterium]HPV46809.1 type II toxin-antitoxin system RelE/ParE family toxin [Kiritimatiellia bacterium]